MFGEVPQVVVTFGSTAKRLKDQGVRDRTRYLRRRRSRQSQSPVTEYISGSNRLPADFHFCVPSGFTCINRDAFTAVDVDGVPSVPIAGGGKHLTRRLRIAHFSVPSGFTAKRSPEISLSKKIGNDVDGPIAANAHHRHFEEPTTGWLAVNVSFDGEGNLYVANRGGPGITVYEPGVARAVLL